MPTNKMKRKMLSDINDLRNERNVVRMCNKSYGVGKYEQSCTKFLRYIYLICSGE